MSSEKDKKGTGGIKKRGGLREEEERLGVVEKFLRQRGRMTEAPTIKKEGTIKKEKKEREADRGDRDREERLRAIQEEPGKVPSSASWLTKEMEKIVFEGSDPSKEDIKLQLRLPNPTKIKDFKEPVKEWEVKENQFKDGSGLFAQGC